VRGRALGEDKGEYAANDLKAAQLRHGKKVSKQLDESVTQMLNLTTNNVEEK